MAINIFHEIEFLEKHIEDPKEFEACKHKLQEYALSCPESEKSKCDFFLSRLDEYISYYTKLSNIKNQHVRLENFVKSWKSNYGVELEYIEPFGKSYGVYISVGHFVMEMVYKPTNNDIQELRTKFNLDVKGIYKQFVLKKGLDLCSFKNLSSYRRDYYVMNVSLTNWVDTIIDIINAVDNNTELFLQLCESSCPFHKDGTHKFKSWRTYAKVEVSYIENTGVIQGLKNGETPIGSHVYGGNGSFRYNNPRTYVIKYTVDRMAPEKPCRHEYTYDVDKYIRELRERLGRTQLPYNLLNSKLENKIEVVTKDMDKELEDRVFYPVDYYENWIAFLEDKFQSI